LCIQQTWEYSARSYVQLKSQTVEVTYTEGQSRLA
jgi:hypothetical protein